MKTTTASPDVDVIVVAYNAGDLLLQSIRSASEQVGTDAVWVMDAGSTDGSVDALRAANAGVHITAVPNAGFSASNNRGIEATSKPLVLLLNPDATLHPGALAALVAAMRAHPSAGIVGAAVYNPNGSAQANAFGRFPTLLRVVGQRFWRLRERAAGNRDLSPMIPSSTASVDWVTGAAMLVNRAAIENAGAMDEAFFLYYEDVEWCHRMRDHGWEVLIEPDARVVHHLGSAAAPEDRVAEAYRASFYRYCDLYSLWGLKTVAKVAVLVRHAFGGRR